MAAHAAEISFSALSGNSIWLNEAREPLLREQTSYKTAQQDGLHLPLEGAGGYTGNDVDRGVQFGQVASSH